MKKEILDVVDENNTILSQTSYAEVHKQKLRHRVVFALLYNTVGDILLQLRSKNKEAYPSMWSFSMGGHVRHGESYLQAIARESKEEIGVSLGEREFTYVGTGSLGELSHARIIYQLYKVMYDGPIEEKSDEVDAVQFVSFSDLKKMISEGKEKFHPQMLTVLERHFAKELEG